MSSMTSVPSMNGAPRIAPTPIWSESAVFVKRIATTGMSVSGVAVPIAARMLPVAPSDMLSLTPSHSIPLVKTSAPSRISANAATISAMSRGVTLRLGRSVGVVDRHAGGTEPAANSAHEREQQHDRGEDQYDRGKRAREEE